MKFIIKSLHYFALGLCIGAFISKSFLYIEQGKPGDTVWMIILGICIIYNFNQIIKETR